MWKNGKIIQKTEEKGLRKEFAQESCEKGIDDECFDLELCTSVTFNFVMYTECNGYSHKEAKSFFVTRSITSIFFAGSMC